MKSDYKKIFERHVEFSNEELEDEELGHADEMDMAMRGIMADMINHSEDTGCREYEIIVRAKKRSTLTPAPEAGDQG